MTRAYFENIEQVILSAIDSSESRLYAAVAWFTNQTISDHLIQACQRQVKIKIFLLDDILNRNEFGLNFGIMAGNGADIRFADANIGTMHHKFCVIDNKVITGSYNWTYHANKNNENVILTDEPEVVRDYCNEFENLFNTASPIKLPYEHLNWIDVKEGDFSEFRRNIFREVIAQNDLNRDLKRAKIINLNHAYKSGNKEDLQKASSLPTEQQLRTITDVLTSNNQDYYFILWQENKIGKPYDNCDGYINLERWYYRADCIKEDKYHYEYIEGQLIPYDSIGITTKGLLLHIYDKEFIATIKNYIESASLPSDKDYIPIKRHLIPRKLLCIDYAMMFFYQFPLPMYNKSQPGTWKNTMPRTISAINLLGIVKEVNGDNVVFYDGWNPQKRGEKIMKKFFVKAL